MINAIITGISQKLDAEFNGIDIYIDQIKQGLVAPCFFIMLLKPEESQVMGNRYHREHSFDIHYFPKLDSTSELYATSDRLMDVLEYIEFDGGLLRGTKRHSEIIDGILHFFINYNFHIIKEKANNPYMEQLKVEGKVKQDGNN